MLLGDGLCTMVTLVKEKLELQMVGMRGGGEKWQWTGLQPEHTRAVTSRSIATPMHAATVNHWAMANSH